MTPESGQPAGRRTLPPVSLPGASPASVAGEQGLPDGPESVSLDQVFLKPASREEIAIRKRCVKEIFSLHLDHPPFALPYPVHEAGCHFTNNVMPHLPGFVLEVGRQLMIALNDAKASLREVWISATNSLMLKTSAFRKSGGVGSFFQRHEPDILSIVLYLHPRGYRLWDFLGKPPLRVPEKDAHPPEDSRQLTGEIPAQILEKLRKIPEMIFS